MRAKIGHLILSVSDWDKSAVFYDKLLTTMGFEKRLDHIGEDWGSIRSYHQGEHGVYIQHNADTEYKEFVRNPGIDHLAFRVDNRAEVEELHELVKTLEVKITREPHEYPEYTPKYYAFYFRDPDGIPLEVSSTS